MKNQPNKMVTLEWLLPLFNQQLSQLSEGWKVDAEAVDFESAAEHYHQLSGALVMANLPRLANLADKLSLLAEVGYRDELTDEQCQKALFSHQLLQYELTQYAQTGSYRGALLTKAIEELTQVLVLAQTATISEQTPNLQVPDSRFDEPTPTADYPANTNQEVSVAVPVVATVTSLQTQQYQQLLTVWRQQVQKLLAENSNQPSILALLEKVSHYLWQSKPADMQQRLWYVTELWLHNLAHNEHPLPASFASIFAKLEQVVDTYSLSTAPGKSPTDTSSDLQSPDSLAQQSLTPDFIEGLIADIYIQLSGLADISAEAQTLLSHLPQSTAATLRFLPRILAEIEGVIFALAKPLTLVKSLQQIKRQLRLRGWTLYESQVSQIIADLTHSDDSETTFAQIERQLQELYSAIYHTEQTIRTKIGDASSFVATDNATITEKHAAQPATTPAIDDALRQLRIAVEAVKHHFNDYVQRQQVYLLPPADAFIEIGSAFDDMGLSAVREVTDKLGDLFSHLVAHDIKTLSWKLTQALAEGLSAIELLLDYLAQQVFDQRLLAQASAYVDDAEQLLDALIHNPIDSAAGVDSRTIARDISSQLQSHDVVRYHDEGEIAPDMDTSDSDSINDDSLVEDAPDALAPDAIDTSSETADLDSSVVESAELKAARTQVQPDSFDMDEEIRDIFIEEANEVIADLEDFLPIWQDDAQDLTPLTEVRRGFHTLKGSGRMVGSFSVSEMAWSIEVLLNQVLDKTLPVTDDVVSLVVQTTQRLPTLVADFTAQIAPSIDPAITILQSNNLLSGQPLNYGMSLPDSLSSEAVAQNDVNPADNNAVSHAETGSTDSDDTHTDKSDASKVAISQQDILTEGQATDLHAHDLQLPAVLAPFIDEAIPLPFDTQDADPDIKEIFIEEAEEVLAEIIPLYEQWQQAPETLTALTDIRRGFHTLKGSGRMVGANYTGELAWSIENMLNRILDQSIMVTADNIQLIGDVLAAYPALIGTFANTEHANYPAIVPLWVACAQAYSKQLGDQFSYPNLRTQWLERFSSENIAHQSETVGGDSQDAILSGVPDVDNMLQTIHSMNEVMADAPAVTPMQSEEEQAFCEIFVDEAQSLLQDINDFVSDNQHQSQIEVSDEIVRAFHTLRAASGSSALVAISDVSATIEKSLEQLQQKDTMMNAQHLQALNQSAGLIDSYLMAYEKSVQQQTVSTETDGQSQQDLASLQAMLEEPDDKLVAPDNRLSVAQLLDSDIDALLDAERQLHQAFSDPDLEQVTAYAQQQRDQIARLAIETADSSKFTLILDALNRAYGYVYEHPEMAHNENIQALLIAGHMQIVGLFDALAGSMSLKVDQQVLNDLYSMTSSAIADTPFDTKQEPDAEQETADSPREVHSSQTAELNIETIDTDSELLEIFLEEAQELDDAIAQTFNEWRKDITNIVTLKVLQRHLHTVKGGARMAGIRSIGDLTHTAESIYEQFVESRIAPTTQWLAVMQMVQDTLSLQINHIINHQQSFFAQELIDQLQQLEQQDELPTTVNLILPAIKKYDDRENSVDNSISVERDTASDNVSLDRLITQSWPSGQPDPDILEVFLEEAEELITSGNDDLQLFLSNDSDSEALQSLQRALHTIKGGARMVAANGIADLAHEMETVYEDLASRRRPATKMIAQLLMACHDWMADSVFILKQHVNPPTPVASIEALKLFSKNPDSLKSIPVESLQAQRRTILAAKAKQEEGRVVANIDEMPPMEGSFAEQEQSTTSSEMIRISGGLIEHMINLSGESAINRARIDMGMSSLTNSIEEMGITVQRLADQLRRMETELEEQVLSQIDDAELINNEGFDPLEMDQYSSLNQLSKSLSESASDLIDINGTLLEKTRDSESLLLQLSRTQTELQDGLMNSRMVSFARLTPRLERIVRQTANELNKTVELSILNTDDEMDKTILERITSPLEHMLRNAVDHGIEDTQTRLKAGKDRVGRISLEVLREGSEVVIHLTDDGRGINVDAVRNKAISQGLIDANDTSLSDLDVIQYIFNAGLTTTKKVTQISGRGVGMDVVISEIRQLGGVVSVRSEAGQGSRFTMRVPLTVAVSDALVVRAADRYYAIPLVQIERVVRVDPEKLYEYYQSGKSTLHIEDDDYRIRYLNEILSGNKLNELMVSTNTSLPLIIVKNRTGQKMALQVDQIAGSRIEVVVKPLGRQLSHLAGISAATIMGDGSVMLILDLSILMRNALVLKEVTQVSKAVSGHVETRPIVLVVDDSVTVRKVTSRFLERQGIDVMVAKDGVDAIEILQEAIPDLILLDIEMPRMDGFEVATRVRQNKRLKHIPIIMITSRTGEKHREHALEIGVNDYMGKPFQENELLSKVQDLLGTKVSLTYDG